MRHIVRYTLLAASCFLLPFAAHAQSLALPAPEWGSMNDFIQTLINIVQTLGMGTALVWFLVSAFRLIAARGDAKALSDAKRQLWIALAILVGMLALMLAWDLLKGTYAALGFIATIFVILFLFWGFKRG